MKKLLILFIIIALVGCSNTSKMNDNNYSIKYNDDYYKIYMPYKKGVGNNYIISSNVVDFDVETIEKELIQLSTNVFSVDKYYYEEGQYLTVEHLKRLLSDDYLNTKDEKTISGHKIKPTIVAGIFEKDFLNKDGKIEGMSLGIVLNPYQAYDQNNNYVSLTNDEVIEYGYTASHKLISYVRNNFALKDIPIMVALYVESSPESNVSGNYLYYGVDDNSNIEFNYIDQKNYYMNSRTVKSLDSNNYNNFEHFIEEIHNYDKTIYVSGLGHYQGNKLVKLDITITKSYYSYGDLLYISELLSQNIIKYFGDIKVIIEVRAINDIKSYIVKEEGETSTDIFIY